MTSPLDKILLGDQPTHDSMAADNAAQELFSQQTADVTAETLDDVAPDAGTQSNGEYIAVDEASTSGEPTDAGFIGAFMSGFGYVFNGVKYQVGAVLNGVLGVGFNNRGQLLAGAGAVVLDVAGVTIQIGSGNANKLKWLSSIGGIAAQLYSYEFSTANITKLQVAASAAGSIVSSLFSLNVESQDGHHADIEMLALNGSPSTLNLIGDVVSVNSNALSGTNTGNETATSIGALIGGAADATPNDTDFVATSLTAGGVLKKITWTNVKAFLKTYFDSLYPSGSGASTGTNTGDRTETVLGPTGFGGMANLTTATAFASQSSYAFHVGTAMKSLATVTVLANIVTALSGATWAELGLFSGTPNTGTATLTRVATADVTGDYNGTGLKTKTFSGLTITPGTDLWIVFASNATTPYQLRGGLAFDLVGLAQVKAATRPSTVTSPTTWGSMSAIAMPFFKVFAS